MGTDWIDLDQPRAHVLPEVMIAHIDVLGARAELWQTSQLQSPCIVFKDLAKYMWLSADDLMTPLPHFLE